MSDNKKSKTMARSWWYIALTILMCFIFLPLGIIMLLCIYFGGDEDGK